MRNYRDLTPHEVERLKDEYPITANRHLAIRYDKTWTKEDIAVHE